MQPKFTKSKILMFLQRTLALFLLGIASFANAQTISTASGSNYLGNLSINNTSPLNVSFVIQNTTGAAVALTDVSCHMAPFGTISFPGDPSVTKLFVSSTSLSGTYDYSTAAWTQIASGNAVVPATLSFVPVITGINYIIPAGAQLRFVLELSKGLRISSNLVGDPMPTPNVFSSGGINLQLGNFQIAGQNVGFGGVAPTAPAGNTPVFFGGTVTLTSTVPCTGTPAPGNTVSSVAAVCPSVPFNLSLQNPPTGSGLSYQWQTAPASTGPWTNAGPNSSNWTTSLTATTWYRCQVTCSAGPNTGTSNPVQVSLNPPSACYCTPTYANGCALGDFISNVTLGTLNNTTACSAPPFTYYSALPAPVLVQGGTYPVSVTVGPDTFGQFVRVWADWNQDGDFNDAGEAVGVSGNVGANGTAIINMTVPATATLGTTRLRVRGGDDVAPTAAQSCGASGSSFGEAEDYNLTIQPCIPISFTSQPSSASITCGNNTSFSVGVSGSNPTYVWEYRVNASSPWQFVPNSAPFSGVTTSTLTLTNVSQAYNGYQFRAVVSGACTALDFSSTATLTVNAIVPVVNPSSATICVGSVQSLTLTNTLGNSDLINEGFNVVSPLPSGWAAQNLSTTVGTTGWFQGNTTVFPAQSGPADSYIGANFNNTTGANTISNWLFTPNINMKNGDVFTFWTRTVSPATFPDRLEVRLSTNGASVNAGATSASVGDFTTLLLSVNPTLTTTGYPTAWTQYTINLSGLPAGITSGRIAFRYFVTDGGPLGSNSDFIGIDNVVYTSTGGPAQGIWGGPAGTIFTDAGATTAYTGTPATTVYVKPTATGVNNYTVSFTTLTPCTSATATVPVTVHSPVTGITSSPATRSVCLGGSTTFTASTTGGTPVNYQWQLSVDGGVTYTNISGATSATLAVNNVTAAMTGNRYRVTTTGNVCGTYTSAPSVLTVLALPNVTITSPVTQLVPGRTTSITASSTPAAATATSWSWTYNGSPLVTTPASNTNTISGINIDRIGSYQATVTDVNGCTNSSNTLVIGTEASDRLWIYPNPTTGQFQVRLYYGSDVAEKRAVHIYDQLGQIIMTKEFNLVTETPDYLQMDFDLSKQARGVYVVKVVHKYSGKIVSGLVIKQ